MFRIPPRSGAFRSQLFQVLVSISLCLGLVFAGPLKAEEDGAGNVELRSTLLAKARTEANDSWQQTFSPSTVTTFDAEALRLEGETDGEPWELALSLSSYGRRGALRQTESRLTSTNPHRAEVDHGGIREFVVGSGGRLTRGFILDQPPFRPGDSHADGRLEAGSGELLLNLDLSGDFQAERGMDGASVLLRHGRTTFSYKNFTATDAQGRSLPTRMVVTEDGLQLRVNAFGAPYPLLLAMNVTQIAKLLPTTTGVELAGWSVDIFDDVAVVSAHYANVGIYPGAGRVYLFERDLGGADNWGLRKEITAPDPKTADRFSNSVALSGDHLVVGAFRADESGPIVFGSGRIYIYERNNGGADNWGHVKTISNPTPFIGDHLGWAVDIDGDTIVTGAFAADQPLLADSGEVMIYQRDEGGADNWGLVTTLTAPTPEPLSYFGQDVAIQGDTVAVGAMLEDVDSLNDGAVHIYERNEGGANVWGHVQSLDASDGTLGDRFGDSVAIDGDTLVVGADFANAAALASGAAYVFDRDMGTGVWSESKKLVASDAQAADYFGWATAIEGDVILVGSHWDDSPAINAGSVYLFRRNEGGADNWGEVERFVSDDSDPGDGFGIATAIHNGTFVVGAWLDGILNTGAGYIFDLAALADLAISVESTPDPVAAGGSVTYTVTVTNNGSDDAENVVVSGTFGPDAGTGSTTTGCNEDPNGSGTCTLGTVPAGMSVQYTVTRPVDAMASGALSFEATVSSSTLDPNVVDNTFTETTQVSGGGGGMADIALLKTDSADPIASGASLVYSLEVLNNGPDDALNVVLVDTLPAGVSGAVTTGCAESPGGVDGCSLGTIMAGTSQTVTVTVTVDALAGTTLTNTATVSTDTEDPNFASNTAMETTNVGTGMADLVISMDDNADPINAGDLLTYTVEVANLSGDTATDVVVTTTLPGSVMSPSTIGCAEDPNGEVTCSLGDIDPGTFETFTLTVTTDAAVFDTLIAEASVDSAASDTNTANNSTTESTLIEASGDVDLWVIQVDSADPVDIGQDITYTILVGNYGPSTAQDVVLTDLLPLNLSGASATGCSGGVLPTCELGTIAPNEIKQVMITATVLEPTPGTSSGDTMSNTVSVTSANSDLDGTNNSATETTTVSGVPGEADLWISVEDSVDPVSAGDSLVYTIQVVNLGPHVASNVVVTSVLPAGVGTPVSAGCAEDPNGGTSCSLGEVLPGVPAIFTLTVPVDLATTGSLDLQVSVDSDTEDPELANNTNMENTAVVATALADLTVTFTAADTQAAPNGTASYEVMVTNNGPGEATDVVLTTAVTGPAGAAVTTGCVEDPSGVPTCTVGTLASGASATVTLEVPVNANATGTLQVDVSGASAVSDPATGDNAVSQITEIDAIPPTVTLVNSVGDTGDGSLDLCEEARVDIDELLVTFSEAMDATLAADAASYQVITAGADRDVDTRQCDTLEGDDAILNLAGVTYDAGSLTATLDLGTALPDGPYRLLVCDTVTDEAGNALDGDEDAVAGVDFRRYFRLDTDNLFTEGHFDCDLDEWTAIATATTEITYTAFDVDTARVSGAAVFYNNLSTSDFSLGQCVSGARIGTYRMEGMLWIRDLETDVTLSRTCEFFPQADCSGAALGMDSKSDVFTATTPTWEALPSQDLVAPSGTQSALCSLDLQLADPTSEITIMLDDLVLTGRLFLDGFETGDTSRWSATVP